MVRNDGGPGRGPGLRWRRREAPSRGPKPGLGVDEIVQAAIAIADAEGLAALSMRRIAERLGFTTMSLYRHVPGKDELVDAMLDAVIGAPPATRPDGWRDALAAWARDNYALHRRHPWRLQATVRRAPIGPNHLRWFDAGLRAVAGVGLAGQQMVAVVLMLEHYIRGAAQLALNIEPEAQWLEAYARTLREVVAEGHLPALARVVEAGTFESGDGPDDFEFGLACVLDGVAALIARHGEKQ